MAQGLVGGLQKRSIVWVAEFIAEVMDILTKQPDVREVVVKQCNPLRFAAETGSFDKAFDAVNSLFECSRPVALVMAPVTVESQPSCRVKG